MAISKNNDDVAAAARRVCYRARVRANREMLAKLIRIPDKY